MLLLLFYSGRFIDFWTTRCTRCPDALDRLNERAQKADVDAIAFVAICCDQLDGAREIMEKDDELRWSSISHYFMAHEDKETAKRVLNFKSVPFYVVLNEEGAIVQSGNKIDWDDIIVPGICSSDIQTVTTTSMVNKENELTPAQEKVVAAKSLELSSPLGVDDVFVLEDLDF